MNDADWFFKADDDTYTIVENLRLFLSNYDTMEHHFSGRWYHTYKGFICGGPGYVFSKKTLIEFNKKVAKQDHEDCKIKVIPEDIWVSRCLRALGVNNTDTKDELGRERYHHLEPEFYLLPGGIDSDNWLHKYSASPVKSGVECCSNQTISFHKINETNMLQLHFFIYHQTLHDFF